MGPTRTPELTPDPTVLTRTPEPKLGPTVLIPANGSDSKEDFVTFRRLAAIALIFFGAPLAWTVLGWDDVFLAGSRTAVLPVGTEERK